MAAVGESASGVGRFTLPCSGEEIHPLAVSRPLPGVPGHSRIRVTVHLVARVCEVCVGPYRPPPLCPVPREGVDLDSCLVRGAPFGGPIAAVRDPNKIVKYVAAMEKINIYTSSGVKVGCNLHGGGRWVGRGTVGGGG
jgi:hypothetical protein